MVRTALTLAAPALFALGLSGCISRQVALVIDEIEADGSPPAVEDPLAPPPECALEWPVVVRSASFLHDDWILAAGPDADGVERLAAGRITAAGIVAEGWVDALAGLSADFTRVADGSYVHSAFEGDEASFIWFDLSDPRRPTPLHGISVGGARASDAPHVPMIRGNAVAICVGDALWTSDGRGEPVLLSAPPCDADRDGVSYGRGAAVAWRHQRGALVPSFQAMVPAAQGFELDQDHGFNPSGNSQFGDIVRAHVGARRVVVEVENRRRFWVVTVGADRDAGAPRLASAQFTLGDDAILGVGSRALWLAGEANARGVDLTDPNQPTLMFSVALGVGSIAPRLLDTSDARIAIRGRDGAARVVARAGGAPLPLRCPE